MLLSRAVILATLMTVTLRAADVPTTGAPVESLKAFDDAVLAFMNDIGATAGTLAVAHHGQLLLQRGYGWRDLGRQRPTQPDTLMRIASVSKPLAGTAVKLLIAGGRLTPETPVFPLLKLQPPPGSKPDPRLAQITVAQLLAHKGGWDRDTTFDPMFHDDVIRPALKLNRPPTAVDIIRYMMGRPLDFEPGSKYAYSNFGYCVLGRVIEKVTAKPYAQHMDAAIFKPLGMADTKLGRTMLRDRDPREVSYNLPDGTLQMERMDANGGMISTAPDLCRFMKAYWISGDPRKEWTGYSWTFFGSLPECTALVRQLSDGTDVAVLINHRRPSFTADNDKLVKAIDAAAGSITDWPKE